MAASRKIRDDTVHRDAAADDDKPKPSKPKLSHRVKLFFDDVSATASFIGIVAMLPFASLVSGGHLPGGTS